MISGLFFGDVFGLSPYGIKQTRFTERIFFNFGPY